tara:strand:+ start:203 stop:784 length:582 start_codon:yes stop_codon:yes gene_type:complete
MIDLSEYFHKELDQHREVLEQTKKTIESQFIESVECCKNSIKLGGKIIFFGNGGSAADAQHLSTELTVKFSKERKAIPAIALTTDTSALTAIGNDLGFDKIFSRQIEALGRPNDTVIAISTSGKSKNVIEAVKTANSMGIKVVSFTGISGDKLVELSDVCIQIPTETVSRIQEMHITIGQMLCNALEKNLGLV